MDKFIIVLLWGVFALGALILGKAFKDGRTPVKEAGQKREEVTNDIQKTPAADLVDAAPNVEELRSDAAGIAGRAKQRLRDRIGKVISRPGGSGNPGGGGSGN
jgi:hypothetical protein